MLYKLLALLQEGRAWSLEDLAEALDTDVPEIKARLEYLEKTGMLRQICSTVGCEGCSGCSSGSNCGDFKSPAMWELSK